MILRRLLPLASIVVVAALGWWFLRRDDPTAGAARPANVEAPPAAATADSRVAVATPVLINGRALDEVKAAARVRLASSTQPSPRHPTDAGRGAASLDEAQAEWQRYFATKYADADRAALDSARLDIDAILEWQREGPFANQDEVLSKDALEDVMRERQWLEER